MVLLQYHLKVDISFMNFSILNNKNKITYQLTHQHIVNLIIHNNKDV